MIDKNFQLKELEVLGKGSFGEVVKCFDEKSWQFFAMKIKKVDTEDLSELA